MIKGRNIHKSYGELSVLKGIDIDIAKGEIVSIVGASGAGKTTLLHILGTLDKPNSGSVEIDGVNITSLNDRDLSAFRNKKIGFIFQFHHLFPEFTAIENLYIPALINNIPQNQAFARGMELLEFLNLSDRSHHKPSELSGGEAQRIAVARALMNKPAVILADEPSGNLDSVHAKELHNLFFKLRDDFGHTFLIVTHNTELANMSDRKLVMKDGLMEE